MAEEFICSRYTDCHGDCDTCIYYGDCQSCIHATYCKFYCGFSSLPACLGFDSYKKGD